MECRVDDVTFACSAIQEIGQLPNADLLRVGRTHDNPEVLSAIHRHESRHRLIRLGRQRCFMQQHYGRGLILVGGVTWMGGGVVIPARAA